MNSDSSTYDNLFTNPAIIEKIQSKLPGLFLLAEIENSRNGKLGMEIGSARERILIALLMYWYGEQNVDVNIPITEPEIDVKVNDEPLSIKTFSSQNNRMSGVKLIWSVDPEKALYFKDNYLPSCDMLVAQIQWGQTGYLYLFSKKVQHDVIEEIGRENYIKLPKQGTNARGVEISKDGLTALTLHPEAQKIPIDFERTDVDYAQAYSRWLELWSE